MLDVREDLMPDVFGFAGDHGIDPGHGLLGAHGGVDAAHDHRYAEHAKLDRQRVGAAGL